MAELRQVVLSWTLPSGTPSRTILNLNTVVSLDQNLTDLRNAFATFAATWLNNTVRVAFPTSAKVFDAGTGAWIRDDTAVAVADVVGASATQAMPDAVQGLIQYSTGTIINNRRLKGRTFVPGMPVNASSGGNTSATANTALAALGNSIANAGLLIWSKPSGSRPIGSAAPVGSVTASPEFAVLRRRRNRITV